MAKRKIKKTIILFFRFLKNHNVYSNYIAQCGEYINNVYEYQCITQPAFMYLLNNSDPFDYMSSFFSWGATKEGFDFWFKLSLKWEDKCKNSCK